MVHGLERPQDSITKVTFTLHYTVKQETVLMRGHIKV